MLVTPLAAPSATPSCPLPAPGPERPQVPVPVPADPPPAWTGRIPARTVAPWFLPLGNVQLRIAAPVGARDGYGTWLDAVTAARELSAARATSVSVLDHRGRLYLHLLEVPPPRGIGRAVPYVLGARGEQVIEFSDGAIRGVVHGPRLVARGDCLLDRVAVPPLPRD